ncbi:hypothetical protein J437_LFUL019386 [Ladona fulva]|nr:hypothetical protein J437_LFUL019386 [Ladona fulva]
MHGVEQERGYENYKKLDGQDMAGTLEHVRERKMDFFID